MKAVITGATGFVGRAVVDELIKQNNEVTVLVRDVLKVPKAWSGRVEVIQAELSELEALSAEAFAEESYDCFFHFAWGGTSGMERADVELQLNNVKYGCDAVRLASRLGCRRFINSGSIMEFEAWEYLNSGDAHPGLGYIYSTAKLASDFMERTLAEHEKIEYLNLVISNIYGAGESSPRFLNSTLRRLLKNEPIDMTLGDQLYDFIYVTDAARAICMVANKGTSGESYYVGNSVQRPLRDFVLKMKEVVGSTSDTRFGAVPFVGVKLSYKEFDTSRLSAVGFSPELSFEEGIRATAKWIEEGN